MTLDQLRRELAKDNLQKLYVIVGDNAPARRQALQLLRERVCPGDLATWSVQEVDGAETVGSAILAMANTPPFLGEQRLVIVQSYEAMPATEQEELLHGLPVADSVVVLLATTIDKRTKVTQALLAKAAVVEVAEPAPEKIVPWVMEQTRLQGLQINHQAAQALVSIAGSDTGFLMQEIEKIKVYLNGKGTVTADLVNQLAAHGEAESEQWAVFRLTDAIVDGNTAVALHYLHELLEAGEHPLRILAMIARQYRLLIAGKAWVDEGVAAAAKVLKMKPFSVEKLFNQARRFSPAAIEHGLKLILDSDLDMKTGADQAGCLYMLTVKLSTQQHS